MWTIRAAAAADYPAVRDFYYDLTDALEQAEFSPGWKKDIYPEQAFLRDSIARGELYLGEEDGQLLCCMIVNHDCNDGYRGIRWAVEATADQVLVIHALGVHPGHMGQGLAKRMVRFVLDMARESGCRAVRLDVLEGNLPAERSYTHLGFAYRDTVNMFYEDTGWTNYRVFEYVI